MGWSVRLSSHVVRKQLKRLDPQVRERIFRFFDERFVTLESAKDLGKVLVGLPNEELWRYRVGDYRIVCRLNEEDRPRNLICGSFSNNLLEAIAGEASILMLRFVDVCVLCDTNGLVLHTSI